MDITHKAVDRCSGRMGHILSATDGDPPPVTPWHCRSRPFACSRHFTAAFDWAACCTASLALAPRP